MKVLTDSNFLKPNQFLYTEFQYVTGSGKSRPLGKKLILEIFH